MKYIYILLIIFFFARTTFAEWNYRYNGQVIKTSSAQADLIFMGRENGITELNTKTKEMRNINSLNSDLKGNYVNAMLKLKDGRILVSTNKGLSLIQDGILFSDGTICSAFPDDEVRLLYESNAGTIWTFSSHKVNFFKNGSWKSIDISDSVRYDDTTTYPFDIWRLFLHGEDVWVLFNDNKKTSTKFNSNVIDLQIRIAVVNENGILKTFQKGNEFPMKQGSYSITDIGDEIIWKNADSVYTFDGKEWKSTNKMNYKFYTPYWNQGFIKDSSGNIWYSATDDMNTVVFPVKYSITTGEVTRFLDEIVNPKIFGIEILDDGTVIAYSSNDVFVKNDDKWDKYNKKTEIGLKDNDYFDIFPHKIQNKNYVSLIYSTSDEPAGTLICLEDSSRIKPIAYDFPFKSLTKVFVNSKGEGLFEGNTTSISSLKYQWGKAYFDLMSFSIGMITKIKNVADGKIYFNGMRLNKETVNSPFVSTWDDINITKIDMGYSDKNDVEVNDFDSHGEEIYALGSYSGEQDSMNVYVSIYNTKDKTLQKYDKNNSDLPDWYWTHSGMFWSQHDTIPQYIQVDMEKNAWILTSYGMLKFTPEKTEKYPKPRMNPYVYYLNMEYDSKYNELLFFAQNSSKIWFFNTINAIWDSLDIENSGIKGSIIKKNTGSGTFVSCKKLLDNRIYASDNLGYLYKYAGQGHFQIIDLNIYGMQKLSFPINDFCRGSDGKFYLATEIGLFSNNNFVSVEENETIIADGIQISPNPASDYIILTIPPLEKRGLGGVLQEIQIFDIFGNCALNVGAIHELPLRIDISSLPAGVYFVRIGDKVEKFVKL